MGTIVVADQEQSSVVMDWKSDTYVAIGDTKKTPYNISLNSWETAVSNPNASFDQHISASYYMFDAKIVAAAEIPLQNSPSKVWNASQVFTGIELSWAPVFTNHSSPYTEWDACIYFTSPGVNLGPDSDYPTDPQHPCSQIAGKNYNYCPARLASKFPGHFSLKQPFSCPSP